MTRNWKPFSTALLLTVVGVVLVYRMWDLSLGVPFDYNGDALPHAMHIKQVTNGGWFWHEPQLAAPMGQTFQDWPLPEILHLAVAWFFGLFTSNWAAVVNGVYLVSFPLVTASAWWVLRKIGVAPWVATVMAVIYSLSPYHFGRGEEHLFLSGYYMLPLGLWLVLVVLKGESLFPFAPGRSRLLKPFTWGTARTLAIAVLISWSGIYYGLFTAMLLIAAGAGRFVITRSFRQLLNAVIPAVLSVAAAVFAVLPSIIYHLQKGPNPSAGARSPGESETYALKMAQLLLPVKDHHIHAFAELNQRYVATFPLPSESWTASLGVVTAVGFLYLLLLPLVRLISPRTRDFTDARGHLSALTLMSFFIGTVGGFSTLIALFVTDQLHAWTRFSIFIAFFSIAALGLLITNGIAKLPTSRRWIGPVGLVALFALAMFDQTTNEFETTAKVTAPAFLSDQAYFAGIQKAMPAGSNIFELPIVKFPESPPRGTMSGYDLLRPFMHTTTLNWSFGGVKGRYESSWQDRLSTTDNSKLVKEIAATTFSGIYIDRNGYDDHAVALEEAIQKTTGARPLVDPTGTKVFYDIRSYVANQKLDNGTEMNELNKRLLFPIEIDAQLGGFYPTEYDGARYWQWAKTEDPNVIIDNTTKADLKTTISFQIVGGVAGKKNNFTVKWPDGTTTQVATDDDPVNVSHEVTLKPGVNRIPIDSDARPIATADTRRLFFVTQNLDAEPVS